MLITLIAKLALILALRVNPTYSFAPGAFRYTVEVSDLVGQGAELCLVLDGSAAYRSSCWFRYQKGRLIQGSWESLPPGDYTAQVIAKDLRSNVVTLKVLEGGPR